MSRRSRFSGHRDHMGRFILGMQNVPPPGVVQGNDNPAASIDMRYSPTSDPVDNSQYPFGNGGVYQVPLGTPMRKL